MDNKKYDLVIFDCDGTLVDTEVLINTACAEALQEMGYLQYTTEYCIQHFTSLSLAVLLQKVQEQVGPSFPTEEFIRRAQSKYLYDAVRYVVQIPNADILLERLSNKRMPFCVASNGEPDGVVESLRLTNLYHFFDPKHIFTYVQSNGIPKPAPDLFLYAARHMGNIPPSRCLVIEDSDTGVRAAQAAGMDVVVIQAHPHPRHSIIEQLKPMAIIKDLLKVEDYINSR